MSESKVTLSKLVGQAWGQLQEMVLEEIRRRVEELAEAERESLLGRGRHVRRGGPLRRWGYRVRKVLLTPWGMISGLRLPRIRDVEAKREVAFLSSEGNQARLAEMLLASTLGARWPIDVAVACGSSLTLLNHSSPVVWRPLHFAEGLRQLCT